MKQESKNQKPFFPGTNTPITKELVRQYKLECKSYPATLIPVDEFRWPGGDRFNAKCHGVWRSRDYAVYAWKEPGKPFMRLTMQKTDLNTQTGEWKDGLTWDEMMALKDQAGFGDRWAVEVFPPAKHTVDVANLRHIWLLPTKPQYAW